MPFGNWLRAEIDRRGWSQADLVARADVPRGTVSRWVNNVSVPPPDYCRRIVGDTTKTSASRRVIPLTDLTLTLLRRHQDRQAFVRRVAGDTWQDDDLVVCSRRGARPDPGTLPAQLKRIAAEAGVPTIRLHDLRHTAATLMLVRGTPVHVVARILGHSDPSTTLKRYSHYVPAYGRDAVDDLERLYATP